MSDEFSLERNTSSVLSRTTLCACDGMEEIHDNVLSLAGCVFLFLETSLFSLLFLLVTYRFSVTLVLVFLTRVCF